MYLSSSYQPPQTTLERIVPGRIGAFSFQLQTDVEHGINSARHVPAPLAFHVALQLASERVMDDAVAGDVRRTAGGGVDLVEGGNEEFVRVLLGIASELCGGAPRCG